MIGFFTDPYPDELLYSVCARYHYQTRYKFKRCTMLDLFGRDLNSIPIGFPSNIDYLVSILPTGHQYTADQIIDENTVLPFYSPFLPHDRLRRLRTSMRQRCPGTVVSIYAGLNRCGIHLDFLRFCPSCVEEDNKLFGESYWHRSHQVPGVEVCSRHCVFLEKSSIKVRVSKLNSETFITAKDAVKPSPIRPLITSDITHQVRLRIAQDISWLLNQRGLGSDLNLLRCQYVELLIQNGMGSLNGQVSRDELQARFQALYPPELLESFHCHLSGVSNWLTRLIRKPQGAQHPLRHLLLINFLGYTAEEFFNLLKRDKSRECKPFGLGPWPCLNYVSEHYRDLRIKEVVINRKEALSRRPRGIFGCDCGFTYSRLGPDASEESRFIISRTLEFGPVWESALTSMWESRAFSVEAMSRKLGSSRSVIRNQAARLGLYRMDTGAALSALNAETQQTQVMSKSNKRKMFREQWLRAVADVPNAGRLSLQRLLPRAHKWLSRHDGKWMETHSPPSRRGTSHRATKLSSWINWEERDIALAAAVKASASQLLHTVGRPIRVSVEAIFRNMNCHRAIVCDRLPQTIGVLADVTETVQSFAIRRIHWAADSMYRAGELITKSYLLEKAAVSGKIAASLEVSIIIESYLTKHR